MQIILINDNLVSQQKGCRQLVEKQSHKYFQIFILYLLKTLGIFYITMKFENFNIEIFWNHGITEEETGI